MNSSIPFRLPAIFQHSRKTAFLIAGIFALVIVSGIGQDYVHSRINKGAFCLSESSLFKVLWLLFIPFLILIARYPWKVRPLNSPSTWFRTGSYSLLFSLVHIFVAAFLIRLLSQTLFDHTFGTARVFRYYISENLFVAWMIYLVFTITGISTRTGHAGTGDQEVRENPPRFIVINSHGMTIPVDVRDILYIRTDRPYLAIVTGNRRHLYASSLKKIMSRLDINHFIRIHRSIIVNINYIACFRSRSNGDYDVEMKNGDTIRLSRNYTRSLRSLLDPSRFSVSITQDSTIFR